MNNESLRLELKAYIDAHKVSQNQLAKRLGIQQSTISRFINDAGKGISFEPALKILNYLGYEIGRYGQAGQVNTTREICFVDARTTPSGEGLPPPISEAYVAVPLVGDVGAGPGMVAEERLEGWVLVLKDQQSIRTRSNLLAVEVGKNQFSMIPTLHPGDLVLVDRDDWGQHGSYQSPGNIFLVREPGQEGGGKIKRVSVAGRGNNTIITFYSDNSEEYEPEPHIVSQDYNGDLREAIVGRVVWAWSDVSRK